MEKKVWVLLSRMMEAMLVITGIWNIWKQDWLWVFACFFGFFLAMLPVIMKRNLQFSIHWFIEFLLVFAISLHIFGGALNLYAIPFYDKVAHFLASIIVAFFALIIVYTLDMFSPRVHMDLPMLAFFIIIFTIAMGTVWEIAEFASDQFLSGGEPVAQVSLHDTMTDLIVDSAAGIIMGVLGAAGIRRGEFKDIFLQTTTEAKKLHTGFLKARNATLTSLAKAIEKGMVDEKMVPIVEKINARTDFFTTSSCAGRIVVVETPSFGNKRRARFLGKWHRAVEVSEVLEALKGASVGELWFLVQSPILHVTAISMQDAATMLAVAIQSGFKHSSIKAANGKIVVEVLTTERIDTPLGIDGKVYGGKEYIALLVAIANKMMERVDRKLKRLEKNLDSLNT